MTRRNSRASFSLVEVVLALGVIGFAIVAILGVFPIALQSGRSAQNETRAAHIAQNIINSVASQAQTNFTTITLPLPASPPSAPPSSITPIDLSSSTTTLGAPVAVLYADNNGQLSESSAGAAYLVSITTNSSPSGFDSGYANLFTVRIAWPAAAAAANQTYRDYVRIVSKY